MKKSTRKHSHKLSDYSKVQKDYYRSNASKFDKRGVYSRENRNHFKKAQRILHVIQKAKPKKILEVGIGTGIHASWLLKRIEGRISYTGVDISKEMLHVARKRLKPFSKHSVRLVEADMLSLPFRKNSFDLVFCAATLHHVDDQKGAISEMVRVLKSGGNFILVEPNPLFPLNFYVGLKEPIEREVFSMKPKNFRKWTKDLLIGVAVENFIYTPPYPEILTPFYDVVDELAGKLPIINRFSIMYFVVGKKL